MKNTTKHPTTRELISHVISDNNVTYPDGSADPVQMSLVKYNILKLSFQYFFDIKYKKCLKKERNRQKTTSLIFIDI